MVILPTNSFQQTAVSSTLFKFNHNSQFYLGIEIIKMLCFLLQGVKGKNTKIAVNLASQDILQVSVMFIP